MCFLSLHVIFPAQTSLIAQAKKDPAVNKMPAPAPQTSGQNRTVARQQQQVTQTTTVVTPTATPQPGQLAATPGMQELPPDLQALLLGGTAGAGAPTTPPTQTTPNTPVTGAPTPTAASSTQLTAALAQYKQKVATLNSKTQTQDQQKIITDFITEILDPALTSKQTTIGSLQDIQKVLAAIIIDLKTLQTSLPQIPAMADHVSSTATQVTLLSNKQDDITRKIEQLGKIASLLATARKASLDNIQNKVNQYLLVLGQINQTIPDFYIQEFIKDLYTLVTAARGQETTKVTIVKQLLDQTALNKALSKDQLLQIQGLITILLGQAATKITPVKIASPEDLKNKLAAIQKLPTLFEKITGCEEALGLVGDTTAQSEKNTLVNIFKDFMGTLPTIKKAELAELRNLFDAASKNPFLLAANQQPIMSRWLTVVTQSLLTIDNTNPLLASVKPLLDQTKNDYSDQLTICNLAVVLATFSPPASEMDTKSSTSLASKIRDKIYFLYVNRGNRSYDDLTMLKNIFTLTKQVPILATLITPQWENTLTLDRALASAGTKTNVLDQLQDFQTALPLLTDKTDAYEKQIFITALSNIFTNRKDRAVIELEKFKDFLGKLTAPDFVSKKIFDKPTNAQLVTWFNIISCTLQLLAPYNHKNLQEGINVYQSLLPIVALPEANYEKNLFSDLLAYLFALRSKLENSDLVILKNFFELIKNTPNLLAQNQLSIFNAWLQDLTQTSIGTPEPEKPAETPTKTPATSSSKTDPNYLDSLITTATQKQDLSMFAKALTLFTPTTNTTTKNSFVAGLNTLFTQRQKLNAKKLLAFFKTVEQKKVGDSLLLSPAQITVLKQWETILASGK